MLSSFGLRPLRERRGDEQKKPSSTKRRKKSPRCGLFSRGAILMRNALFDHGVCRMIVYGFEIFRFHHIGVDAAVPIQRRCNVTHEILYELWIVVSAFRDIVFVRSLEQAVKFTGSLLLGNTHQLLDPDMAIRTR